MQLPYAEPLTVREPGERVVPEPPRRGEAGGEPCGICTGQSTAAVWQDEHFSLHPPVGGSLPGAVWLASREHVDSFSDLSPEAAAAFGPLAARVERAILGARRRRPGAPLSLGRRRRALPRLVHAAAARDARGVRNDAPALGGRPSERHATKSSPTRRGGSPRRCDGTLARRLGTVRRRRHRARLDDRRRGLRGVRARPPRRPGAGCWSGSALAAGVAYCNAVASAQLAAQYPTSGGTYVYGRERLGEWWGFLAGWGFVIGKTASCAAMALTFAAYAVPGPRWLERLVAAVRGAGAHRGQPARHHADGRPDAHPRRGVARCAGGRRRRDPRERRRQDGQPDVGRSRTGSTASSSRRGCSSSPSPATRGSRRSARRSATRSERSRARSRWRSASPSRSTPSSPASVLLVLGPEALAASATPLVSAVEAVGADWAVPLVDVGAAVASLGALLALIAGIGRTTLAMAREGDLPRWLASVHPRYRVPDHAELAVAVAVTAPRPDHRPARGDRASRRSAS